MKISFILILVLGFLLSYVLPWWVIGPLCFGVSFFMKLRPGRALAVSFFGIFVLWIAQIYWLDAHSIQEIIGGLFNIPNSTTPFLASAIGGVVGGVFGLSGSLLMKRG